ncbi:MAG: hypothetical protein GC190_22000 [Alphaproteobacteria bacterium]|nr:hypothetical protein [Alphaproteobacteria bacterium]
MSMPMLSKKSGEATWRTWDFTDGVTGTSIDSITNVTIQNLGEVAGSAAVTSVAQEVQGTFINLKLAGGTDGEVYLITVTILTADGQTLVLGALLYIQDPKPYEAA